MPQQWLELVLLYPILHNILNINKLNTHTYFFVDQLDSSQVHYYLKQYNNVLSFTLL